MAFVALPLHQLLLGAPTAFDLYMQYANGQKVLFCVKGHLFSCEQKEHLLQSDIDCLYIKEEDCKKLKQYRADNLVLLLQDSTLNSDERAQLLHESVSDQMQDMFDHGVRQSSVANSKKYIEAMVAEMMSNKVHSEALLRLTAHDYSTYSHSVNVAIYALALGKELGLSVASMTSLGAGALLHDLGKSKISPFIINKPGPLTFAEYQKMKKHPEIGYEILVNMGETDPIILNIVLYHHEKLDGSGYAGILGDAISIETQVVTVADIFDALTTNRTYKMAASYFTSFKTMKVVMKYQINMKYVDLLIKLMGKE
ncbi:MAG: HD domain-containing protein [Sulfurimonas sp.]|nr:HD domain-containing protein [Sulfurimonas sp.]